MGYIWSENEKLPRPELEKLQLKKLRRIVAYIYERVPFYREKMKKAGVKPEDVNSLSDLQKLPFTTKDDLRENYPFGLFAVPLGEIVEIHASSGTTGKLTVVGYTRNDIELWKDLMAMTLAAGGVTSEDIFHNAYGYGLFTGGLGFHYGAQRIGATIVPHSSGNTKRQIMLIKDFGATAVGMTPSYALYMAEVAEQEGIDLRELPVRVGFFGAEPWSDSMRKEIESRWGIEAFDIYGLSELIGPGVSVECEYHNGLHIFEEHFIAEIIDPETEEVLPPGEVGELVVTTLSKEALPLIRYRTRDITRLHYEPCACGRTTVRMDKVMGRSDDMLIVRGVNVFPSQIEEVLVSIEETEPHYQIVLTREHGLDVMEILVEVKEEVFSDEIKRLEELAEKIENELESVLAVRARVKLVEPGTIERSMGKAKRVIDKRNI